MNAPFSSMLRSDEPAAAGCQQVKRLVSRSRSCGFGTRDRVRLIAIGVLCLILLGGLAVWCILADSEAEEPLPSLTELLLHDRLGATSLAQFKAAGPPPLQGEAAVQRNASAPFVDVGPPAKPFRFIGTAQDRLRARTCLAAAMFYEAGDDGIGQLAVGQVVLNRVRHPAFPSTICGVVTQGSERARGCQFTFTCDGALVRRASPAARARAIVHAGVMLDGMVFAGVGLATHYHTDAVYPWWSSKLEKIARVGSHLFFRWPGGWGSAQVDMPHPGTLEPSAALFAGFAGEDSTATPPPSDDAQVAQAALPMSRATIRETGDESAAKDSSRPGYPAIPLSRRLTVSSAAVPEAAPDISGPVLEGARLLRVFPHDNVFHLVLDPSSNKGARQRIAEMLCGGRQECRVYGWQQGAAVPSGPELTPRAQQSLAFTYIRHAATNRDSGAPAIGAM